MYFSLKNILSGGFGALGAIGTGTVGGKIYDTSNPTINSILAQKGYVFSVVELNGTKHKPISGKFFDGKNGGCATRIFSGATFGYEVDTNQSTPSYSTNPIQITDSGKSIGCLEMKMYPWEDQEKKQRFYFQSEVAIKNEKFGVVLGTGILFGKVPHTDDNNKNTFEFEFPHRMILLEKTSEQGEIKKGYGGSDGSVLTNFEVNNNPLTLKTPDEYGLKESKIEEISESHSYLGVGEEKPDLKDADTTTNSPSKEDDGNHPLKDIDIVIHFPPSDDQATEVSEVYGLDKDKTFDSSSSKGYGHSSHLFYEADKWKKMNSTGVHTTLNKGYSIFKDKKGKGTEINKRCYDLSVTRTTSLDIDQLRDLCYKKSL